MVSKGILDQKSRLTAVEVIKSTNKDGREIVTVTMTMGGPVVKIRTRVRVTARAEVRKTKTRRHPRNELLRQSSQPGMRSMSRRFWCIDGRSLYDQKGKRWPLHYRMMCMKKNQSASNLSYNGIDHIVDQSAPIPFVLWLAIQSHLPGDISARPGHIGDSSSFVFIVTCGVSIIRLESNVPIAITSILHHMCPTPPHASIALKHEETNEERCD